MLNVDYVIGTILNLLGVIFIQFGNFDIIEVNVSSGQCVLFVASILVIDKLKDDFDSGTQFCNGAGSVGRAITSDSRGPRL